MIKKEKKNIFKFIIDCGLHIDKIPPHRKHQKIYVTNKYGVKGIFVLSLTCSDYNGMRNFKSDFKKLARKEL